MKNSYRLLLRISILSFAHFCSVSAQNISWQQTNGPYGGNMLTLFELPNGDILASTRLGGIYCSSNNGESWGSRGLVDEFIWDFTVQPNGDLFAGATGGVYRSTDSGTSWQHVLELDAPVKALLTDSSGVLLAGSHIQDFPARDGLLFRSLDGGNTWVRDDGGLRGFGTSLFANHADGGLLAGMWTETSYGGGLFRSSDHGMTWQEIGLQGHYVIDLHLAENGLIYVATAQEVWISADSAKTWQPLNDGLPEEPRWLQALTSLPDGTVLASVYFDVYRLDGAKWTTFSSGLQGGNVSAFLRTDAGEVFAGTTTKGVFQLNRSDSVWVAKNAGIINTSFTSLIETTDGHVLAGSNLHGIHRTRDKGVSWQQTSVVDEKVRTMAVAPDGAIYAGTSGFGGALKSSDNGATWEKLGLQAAIINSFFFQSSDEIFATTYDGIYHSTDAGKTWELLAFANIYTSFLVKNQLGQLLVYGSRRGEQGFYSSSDDGATWEPVWIDDKSVTSLAINSIGHIFVATGWGVGIFRSTDHGMTWQQTALLADTGLEEHRLYVGPLAITAQDEIYAGTSKGVYLSDDNGESWSNISAEFIPGFVTDLHIDSEGYLFAATDANGIFRTEQPVAVKRDFSFLLEQNYPNPFNAETTFQFTLPKSGFVSLKIYDTLGREVAAPLAEARLVGLNHFIWNAGALASGVYIARLQAGEHVDTRKVLLVK